MSKADKRKLVWLLSAAALLVATIIVLMVISNSLSSPTLPDGLPEFPGECKEVVESPYGGVTAYFENVSAEAFDDFVDQNPEYVDFSHKYDNFTVAIAFDTQKNILTVTVIE